MLRSEPLFPIIYRSSFDQGQAMPVAAVFMYRVIFWTTGVWTLGKGLVVRTDWPLVHWGNHTRVKYHVTSSSWWEKKEPIYRFQDCCFHFCFMLIVFVVVDMSLGSSWNNLLCPYVMYGYSTYLFICYHLDPKQVQNMEIIAAQVCFPICFALRYIWKGWTQLNISTSEEKGCWQGVAAGLNRFWETNNCGFWRMALHASHTWCSSYLGVTLKSKE